MTDSAVYLHGHHESVLCSHSWRTVDNSAAYLVKYLQPNMRILDIGCGPGTLTSSFARLVPQGHVTGVDNVPKDSEVFVAARQHAAKEGLTNVTFTHGDVYNLERIPDGTFDVVHCHQVLQHVTEPVRALKEMRRVAKPGGLVAVHETDAGAFTWFPETEIMMEWISVYKSVARANETEPDAGRRLVAWALEAGFARGAIDATAGTWLFSTPEERAWWSEMWADRIVQLTFARLAVEKGVADKGTLERIATGWREWAAREEGWFAILHGEIVCVV